MTNAQRERRLGNLKFYGLMLGLLAAGLACVVVGDGRFSWPRTDTTKHLIGGLGEALIIAVVLSLLVDPFVKTKLAREAGRDLFWALFSPSSPDEFREAFQELARPEIFYSLCSWHLNLEWVDEDKEIVELTILVKTQGVNVGRKAYVPSGVTFVLGGHDGSPSRYIKWSMSVPMYGVAVDLPESEITAKPSVNGRLDVNVDAEITAKGLVVPAGEAFVKESGAIVTRRAADDFPLFNNKLALRQQILLTGGALVDLNVGITQSEEGFPREKVVSGTSLTVDLPGVAFPGSATVVEWKRKTPGSGDRQLSTLTADTPVVT